MVEYLTTKISIDHVTLLCAAVVGSQTLAYLNVNAHRRPTVSCPGGHHFGGLANPGVNGKIMHTDFLGCTVFRTSCGQADMTSV